MYIPKHFEEHDLAVLHALIRSHPLGTWVVQADGHLMVNHIPFVVDASGGLFGTLRAHVARANPVWKSVLANVESVVVFQGPQSYISPSWYPTKHENGKVVPTWNYAVVHAHGAVRVVDDPEWLRHHVGELTTVHESSREQPWQVSDAPSSFIDGLVTAIVGIELTVGRLTGKWKTSQNRPVADRKGVVAGLNQLGDDASLDMARLVEERMPPRDPPG